MKLLDVLTKLDNFSENERAKYRRALLKLASPYTKEKLNDFLKSYDHDTRPIEELIRAENMELYHLFKMEMTMFGSEIRREWDLTPLKEDTEIIID